MSKKQFILRFRSAQVLILFLAVITVVSGCVKKQPEPPVVEDNEQKVEEQNGVAEEQEQKVEDTVTATATEEIDTSDWQIYRNKEYGFEVEYPENWVISESDDFAEDLFIIFKGENNKMFILSVYNNNDKQLLKTYNRIEDQYKKLTDQVINYPKNNNAIKLYIITGKVTPDQLDETSKWFKSVATIGEAFLEVKEYSYNFWFPVSPAKSWDRKDELAILKSSLKTFKILDNPLKNKLDTLDDIDDNQQANVLNWPIYRDEKYEFEVKYPENWFIESKYNDSAKRQSFSFMNFKGSMDEYSQEFQKNANVEKLRLFFINIYSKENNEKGLQEYDRIKAQYSGLANEISTYPKDKGEVKLYIVDKRSPRDQKDETWDWVLPIGTAFLETEDYNYKFSFSTGRYGSDEYKIKLAILEQVLQSFEFINKE